MILTRLRHWAGDGVGEGTGERMRPHRRRDDEHGASAKMPTTLPHLLEREFYCLFFFLSIHYDLHNLLEMRLFIFLQSC